MQEQASAFFQELQDRICQRLETLDSMQFEEDFWQREGGGGGRTRVLTNGSIFEKAGVNFSDVHGEFTDEMVAQLPGDERNFTACGISLVLHPYNPMIPTVHANFRYITKGDEAWFGGGADLTPYYPYREDVIHFHRTWRDVCEKHSSEVVDYAKFKQWCDDYFFIKHRNEPRGVGGIFFDYLKGDLNRVFEFVKDAGDSFLNAYVPIVERRMDESFTDEQKEFQEYRRGRYVEFNLIYDRGTLFGLKTGGRIESIFMSLPLKVQWWYDYQPEPGSREAELYEVYLKPHDWANES